MKASRLFRNMMVQRWWFMTHNLLPISQGKLTTISIANYNTSMKLLWKFSWLAKVKILVRTRKWTDHYILVDLHQMHTSLKQASHDRHCSRQSSSTLNLSWVLAHTGPAGEATLQGLSSRLVDKGEYWHLFLIQTRCQWPIICSAQVLISSIHHHTTNLFILLLFFQVSRGIFCTN